ncbi:MAG: hypothetical protein CL944_00675 [Candidatus Diapherotrites archaeon]|uniref:Protein export membrane protein SecD/SecF C-terminal domain-containing protein n=1 Tax=Candidatus Iainarchaeum sp. TaxID=3101447 RepID=A0A2D6LP43_9ARCH|nr:hypothetical protein [Candidatus Diapherotrites archaeon]|tara:strand:+ start:14696 stop:16330 length:1635 start_codon:yes stop_codon:yes gene_type:complete
MREAIKKPRVLLLIAFVLISLLSISLGGLEFGIDFKGGTLFQIQLEEKVTPDKMETIVLIVGERLDAFGLKDTKVNSLGDDFVSAQIAETDPEKIEHLESLLRTQGKFEATINGELLFEGSDIIQIYKDASNGYGVIDAGQGEAFTWQLPFLMNQKAAENFSRKTFHKCDQISFDVQYGGSYNCESTFFFIDRPSDSVIIVPQRVFSNDTALLGAGSVLENIPQGTSIDDLLENAGLTHFIVSDTNFTSAQLAELENLVQENPTALVHDSVSSEQKQALLGLGYDLVEVSEQETIPWLWTVTGARQVIALTPGIANLEPRVDNIENAKIFSQLLITGTSISREEATTELKALEVLLETGSLPIGIRSISKETISPLLGKEFLNSALLIGLVGLIIVALVVFIRYKNFKLVIPILITGASEIIMILGFASLVKYNLDLAAVAGILAAVGTGVDHQIIITDELLRGEMVAGGSFVNRIKRAFFIIMAAAATTIATMLPIIIFSFGLGKLRGFAITIVVGVLVGVLISRPAFSILAEHVLKKKSDEA